MGLLRKDFSVKTCDTSWKPTEHDSRRAVIALNVVDTREVGFDVADNARFETLGPFLVSSLNIMMASSDVGTKLERCAEGRCVGRCRQC